MLIVKLVLLDKKMIRSLIVMLVKFAIKFVSVKSKEGNKRISMIILTKLDQMMDKFQDTDDRIIMNVIA